MRTDPMTVEEVRDFVVAAFFACWPHDKAGFAETTEEIVAEPNFVEGFMAAMDVIRAEAIAAGGDAGEVELTIEQLRAGAERDHQ